MLFTILCLCLGLTNSINNSLNLPPISKIYKAALYVPFLGTQYIEYERLKELQARICLTGFVEAKGYINYIQEEDNLYELDNTLLTILDKFRCVLDEPYYDSLRDIIKIKIKLKIRYFNLNKKIILKTEKRDS